MKIDGLSSGFLNMNPPEAKTDKIKADSFRAQLEKAFDENDKEKLKDACKDFETVFMNIMYKQMRATVPKGDMIPNSFAKQTFESMLDEEVIEEASKGGGIGIGDMLFKQLSHRMSNQYRSKNTL